MAAKAKKVSSAARLVGLVWEHNREATGHSWQRLNNSMSSAVCLAIDAGMEFAVGDFGYFSKNYRGSYWMGNSQGENGFAERFYSRAIGMNHLSACQSFEAFKGRQPFIFKGQRLGLGSEIEGFKAKTPRGVAEVTSFSKCGTYLNAVAKGWTGKEYVILQRLTYTLDELRTQNAAAKRARDEGVIERLIEKYAISVKDAQATFERALAVFRAARFPSVSFDTLRGHRGVFDKKHTLMVGCTRVRWKLFCEYAVKQGWIKADALKVQALAKAA